jgi:hypothetical protein
MYEVEWIKGPVDGRVGIVTPYNEQFKEELKAVTSSAKFRRADGAWCFDEELRPEVMPLVDKFFTRTSWQRVTIHLDRDDNFSIDGANLLYVNRDNWSFRRGDVNFRVVEQNLQSGGSRANPHVSGTLVLDVEMREGAIIKPEPKSVEPVGEQEKPNPLANYAVDDLAAELARREATTAAMLKDADLLAELKRRGIKLYDTDGLLSVMKASLEKIYPEEVPDEEAEVAKKLRRFVGLIRLALEGSDE